LFHASGSPQWFIDTASGDELCQRYPVDEVARCKPSLHAGRIMFADDACTESVVIHQSSHADPEYDPLNPTGPRYASAGNSYEDPLYNVGALLSADAPVYYFEGQSCVPYAASGQQTWPIFELLDAIPDEEFGILRLELRP
jgi:hypothetical protein